MDHTISIFLSIQARSNCHGNEDLQDGICKEFKCIDHTSCNCNGKCTSDGTACDCDDGFTGFDCAIDLKGKKSCADYLRITKLDQEFFGIQ